MQFGERIGLFSHGIILLTAVTLRLFPFGGGCGVTDSVKLAPAFLLRSRRTFIVNALSHGISPTIVMKWTGHASYSSMKPYIDIVDSIKATEMAKR